MITKPTIQKRRGRPPGSGSPNLRLTCLVTGAKRATNFKYVEKKAFNFGVSVEDITENYVSKEGLKLLDTIPELAERKDFLIRLNGGVRFRKPSSSTVSPEPVVVQEVVCITEEPQPSSQPFIETPPVLEPALTDVH